MDTTEVAPLLGRTDLGSSLSDDERRTIARLGTVDVADEGAVLMTEGEPGAALLLLLEGQVAVTKGGKGGRVRELTRLGPGAVLGEVALLQPAPRTATVRALTPVRYFRVPRGRFQEELDTGSPAATKLTIALAGVLANRLRALTAKVVELAEGAEEGASGQPDTDLLDDLIIEIET